MRPLQSCSPGGWTVRLFAQENFPLHGGADVVLWHCPRRRAHNLRHGLSKFPLLDWSKLLARAIRFCWNVGRYGNRGGRTDPSCIRMTPPLLAFPDCRCPELRLDAISSEHNRESFELNCLLVRCTGMKSELSKFRSHVVEQCHETEIHVQLLVTVE